MTALADRPQPHLPLRLASTGLRIELGQRGGHGYAVTLEPEVALALARDLQVAAHRALAAGGEALADLDRITEGAPDA